MQKFPEHNLAHKFIEKKQHGGGFGALLAPQWGSGTNPRKIRVFQHYRSLEIIFMALLSSQRRGLKNFQMKVSSNQEFPEELSCLYKLKTISHNINSYLKTIRMKSDNL